MLFTSPSRRATYSASSQHKLTLQLASAHSQEAPRPGHPDPSSPELRRAGPEPPPAACSRQRAAADRLRPQPGPLQVRLGLLVLLPHFPLAAGAGPRRKSARPSLPCSESQPGTSFEKNQNLQGLICKMCLNFKTANFKNA